MSSEASSTSRLTTSTSQVVMLAEPGFRVGIYKVSANQVRPHPSQRLLSQEWVDSLHQRFQEVGIDRAAHPIKVLLKNSQDEENLMPCSRGNGSETVEELPKTMVVLVYHGQHRIAACLKMEDVTEHWWYAEVYRPGMYPEPHQRSA